MDPNDVSQPPHGAPPLVDGGEERLERRVVAYWYATDLLKSLVLAAILVIGVEFWRQSGNGPTWAPVVAWIAGGLLVFVALVVPPFAFANWRFTVDDRLLSLRFGILFLENRHVPVPRMQHVDLMRGPIERLFGLATLVVFTAGNEGSAFRVPGLSRVRAEALRDRILRARGRDVV
jgi:hypothetical protein